MRNVNTRKSTFSIPEPLLLRLDSLSGKSGWSKSVIMALALKEFLEKEEKKCRK